MTKQWVASFAGEDIRLAEELKTLLEEKRGIILSQGASVKAAVRMLVKQLRTEPKLTSAA